VLKDALIAFNKQDYTKSISLFSILLELNKKDVNAWFYSALCFYHNNNNAKAIVFLDKVLENENNVFDQEAEWYKAQALIKTNDKEAALELLLKINSRRGFYADKAGDKLKEIVH
jgi:tetratricopeptide (TPR) repeat protein